MENNNIENHENGCCDHKKIAKNENPLFVVGQILAIIMAVFWCFTIIGMAWGIPMIIGCLRRLDGTKETTIAHIVILFLFYGIVSGILTLVGITD